MDPCRVVTSLGTRAKAGKATIIVPESACLPVVTGSRYALGPSSIVDPTVSHTVRVNTYLGPVADRVGPTDVLLPLVNCAATYNPRTNDMLDTLPWGEPDLRI